MPRHILFFVFTFFSISTFAFQQAISPERLPGQSWEEALGKSVGAQKFNVEADNALEVSEIGIPELGGIPEWPGDLVALKDLFFSAKGSRIHANPNPGDYQRKAAWLYVNDGCYSKAAHVSYVALGKGYPAAGKIYAFGNLRFQSPYAKNGSAVYWSYHMAAAYHKDGVVYVVDPAVSTTDILTVDEWLAQISTNPPDTRISLCDSHSYSPLSRCLGGRENGAYLGHMRGILLMEWSNLARLGFSPEELLGPGE